MENKKKKSSPSKLDKVKIPQAGGMTKYGVDPKEINPKDTR